jgi:hypothetical protein
MEFWISMLHCGGLKGLAKVYFGRGDPHDIPMNQTSSGAHPLWRSVFYIIKLRVSAANVVLP